LDHQPAAYCLKRAIEDGQQRIAWGINQTAVMLGYGGLYDLATMAPHASKCALLVGSHQPAVTRDVGHQNCRQPTLTDKTWSIIGRG
jgi:hypothetical protein